MKTYFIEYRVTGAVKIGRSKDPEERLKELQTAIPGTLRLVHAMDRDWEKLLHKRFNGLRLTGEWFRPNRHLWDCIRFLQHPDRITDSFDFHSWCLQSLPLKSPQKTGSKRSRAFKRVRGR